MTTQPLIQPHKLNHSGVIQLLTKLDPKARVIPEELVYYPYYFLQYQLNAKALLRLTGKVACTIDGISGQGALVDAPPEWRQAPPEPLKTLPVRLMEDEAIKQAESFVYNTAIQKVKYFTTPKLKRLSCKLFHRPYWIVRHHTKCKEHHLIVDAITGKYHPL
ncbi:hypothetical protein J2S00_001472 [Caldalkalibacillus uzonensis]|uniref:Uncharacterized protein n=1 Tax=Caldalkalibacillus uzonensis TaxID=353224 RepID=A0ABU0CS39_9BACI|nr:hypothetical protein [Caldalkalibacillus uzonensis]MDQ0338686.1 hypothetical protein [Caldalkalibacillus uzonensis]